MAMNELRKEVEAAAMAELNRANAKFPLFNSTHEGYAVILEEAEEAQEAMENVKESEELNMVAQAERLKISTTEENRAIKALQEAAYIKGYMTAELRERERRKKARERKKRKRYFLTQKLYGVAMLILTAVSVKLLEGDITVAFILVPMGIVLITSKEMVIVNKYFWECEGKEWYL